MTELTQTHHLWLYFALVAGVIVLPGMDMAFVLASALARGRRAGLAAVAGMVCGGLAHLALALLGVGLVLATAPRLANALLLAGALYVGWTGWALWRHGAALGALPEGTPRGLAGTFGRAMATCLLNPKAYVFMLAVFPQFLRAEYGPWAPQAAALGAITAATQAVVYGAVALCAAGLRSALLRHEHAPRRLGRAVGALLVASAAWALATGWQG